MTESKSLYPELHGKTVKFVDWDETSTNMEEVLKVDFTDGSYMKVVSRGHAYCSSSVGMDLYEREEAKQ